MRIIDRAIEIKPDYAEAYNNRGNAYNGLGNYRQAIEDFNRAIEIKPDYAEAYYNRGNAYNSLGNYRQAIEDYEQGDRNQTGLCRWPILTVVSLISGLVTTIWQLMI